MKNYWLRPFKPIEPTPQIISSREDRDALKEDIAKCLDDETEIFDLQKCKTGKDAIGILHRSVGDEKVDLKKINHAYNSLIGALDKKGLKIEWEETPVFDTISTKMPVGVVNEKDGISRQFMKTSLYALKKDPKARDKFVKDFEVYSEGQKKILAKGNAQMLMKGLFEGVENQRKKSTGNWILSGLNGIYPLDDEYSLRFSTNIIDIMSKSTGQFWNCSHTEGGSCEGITGIHNTGFISDIENNNAIVFVYKNGEVKARARLMLRWCEISGGENEGVKTFGMEPTFYAVKFGELPPPTRANHWNLAKINNKSQHEIVPNWTAADITAKIIEYAESKGFEMNYALCITPYKYKGYSDTGHQGTIKYKGNLSATGQLGSLAEYIRSEVDIPSYLRENNSEGHDICPHCNEEMSWDLYMDLRHILGELDPEKLDELGLDIRHDEDVISAAIQEHWDDFMEDGGNEIRGVSVSELETDNYGDSDGFWEANYYGQNIEANIDAYTICENCEEKIWHHDLDSGNPFHLREFLESLYPEDAEGRANFWTNNKSYLKQRTLDGNSMAAHYKDWDFDEVLKRHPNVANLIDKYESDNNEYVEEIINSLKSADLIRLEDSQYGYVSGDGGEYLEWTDDYLNSWLEKLQEICESEYPKLCPIKGDISTDFTYKPFARESPQFKDKIERELSAYQSDTNTIHLDSNAALTNLDKINNEYSAYGGHGNWNESPLAKKSTQWELNGILMKQQNDSTDFILKNLVNLMESGIGVHGWNDVDLAKLTRDDALRLYDMIVPFAKTVFTKEPFGWDKLYEYCSISPNDSEKIQRKYELKEDIKIAYSENDDYFNSIFRNFGGFNSFIRSLESLKHILDNEELMGWRHATHKNKHYLEYWFTYIKNKWENHKDAVGYDNYLRAQHPEYFQSD